MQGLERARGVIAGRDVDHLPVQPMVMTFAARHAGVSYSECAKSLRCWPVAS